MDFQQIADRINRLIGASGQQGKGRDKRVNAAVAKAVKVSPEAVRQWRKGDAMPRLEKLEPLCQYLAEHKIEASPPYLLFGFHPKEVHVRERIADEGDELTLLKTFRAANSYGRARILDTAAALQLAHPRAANVVQIRQKKRRAT